eukprot:CAMPEP_0197854914 /NCGR_PEP_ID=MMETSP1438-20131217/25571_1 /TAXON_ID=1461541 /ORGANISM="Pterosperma sp., Strain CCMP1384" /LENGTH=97 /DNA_ID=CAMNT_0043469827 /DNA_START=21 /DNA_END=311 /DNA_ORIENTATION=+
MSSYSSMEDLQPLQPKTVQEEDRGGGEQREVEDSTEENTSAAAPAGFEGDPYSASTGLPGSGLGGDASAPLPDVVPDFGDFGSNFGSTNSLGGGGDD